ncbi:MAG: hypothetical protein LBL49_00350 [Clostridiales Family XIII bacterium]|jgi:hypothetical protein|nr:hypothetical protein [Clostridiales Family XIII bacterium]
MKRAELTNLERFNITDSKKALVYKGFDQEWYGFWWRRLAGCGPTTVSNMLLYEFGRGGGVDEIAAPPRSAPIAALERSEVLAFMNRTWKHVTPGKGGINTTQKLVNGIESYAYAAGFKPCTESLDVPEGMTLRPRLEAAAEFIEESVKRDRPVAFLNLDNGSEKQLDKWHWVTIIAIEYIEYEESSLGKRTEIILDVLDNCNIISVNLGSWLKTSVKGGGFVKFEFILNGR